MHLYPEQSEETLDQAEHARNAAMERLRNARNELSAAEENLLAADANFEKVRRAEAAKTPVDRSALQLSGGGPVTEDHREIDPRSGQQKGYVVLTPAERAKGFTRPYRDAYRHLKCGRITIMSRDIAETYARDPYFYVGTFCTACRAHFPVGEDGEFTWYEMDGREGPKVGT